MAYGMEAICAGLLAALTGASVPAQALFAVALNEHSTEPLHAVYVSAINTGIGITMLSVPAVWGADMEKRLSPCVQPRRWMTSLGGLASLPSVASIPASRALGIQAAMLVMLFSQLLMALVLDVGFARSTRLSWQKCCGLMIVLGGVALNEFGMSTTSRGGEPFGWRTLVYTLLCALAGAAYALQSLCNRELAKDIRSGLRATCVSGLVSEISLLPIWVSLWASSTLEPKVEFSDWHLWLICGCQFAGYVLMMTLLPRFLPYTVLFLCSLVGQLVCSSIIDATGIGKVQVPIGWARAVALATVVFGCVLYNTRGSTQTKPVDSAADRVYVLMTN